MDNSDIVNEVHSHSIDIKHRSIYLHGYVPHSDEDPGVEYRMAVGFIKNMNILQNLNKNNITIHMHSIGGDWASGMVIYDRISLCNAHVTIIAYGQAESMSSIILQAADTRIVSPSAYVMCHYGVSNHEGNYLDAQASAKFEKGLCNYMLDIYANSLYGSKFFKTNYNGGGIEKAKNYLARKLKAGDWYLSAEESIYYGFADSILTPDGLVNG